ncbi:MAG: hypothetical protein WC884_03170 [Candidatus Paceibacterota bacterium]
MEKMISKNKTIKFISALLIFSILAPSILFSRPKKVEALWPVADVGPKAWIRTIFSGTTSVASSTSAIANTTNTAISIKNVMLEILRQAIMVVQRRLLQELTKSTINWINSGFHGAPLFLENPGSFFRDIAKYEIRTMVDIFGYDLTRFPFGKDFALNTINSYKNTLENNAAYTLSKVMTDPVLLHNYQNNFNVGGWNAFLINTQYPQNNYLGFQMIATEALARKVQGTVQNNAQKVQTTLQQGMGFLSPQTCPSNPEYNKVMANAFQRPSFQSKIEFVPPDYTQYDNVDGSIIPEDPNNPIDKLAIERAARAKFDADKIKEKADWTKANTCPGGLVATTPGSVVANQITSAMGSQFRQSELAAALGNSISSILDALLNKFMGDGLSALSTKTNPPATTTDNWDYSGQTLGSPTNDNPNAEWDSGPDVPIILNDFKKTIQDGIKNTNIEILLMYNQATNNPGISQMLGEIWPKVRDLDQCLPGPDFGWQDRLDSEMGNVNINQNTTQTNNPSDLTNINQNTIQTDLTTEIMDELKLGVNLFKDWINNNMLTELPNSSTYIDAINDLKNIYQQSSELSDKKKIKTNALVRLESIKDSLDTITTQPATGTNQETTLINLKKKYDAIILDVSNITTIGNTQNELDTAKDKLSNLIKLITKCKTERTEKGWSIPGGATSTISGSTEQNEFCNAPIKGGYSHKSFINLESVTHPEIPLVNAKDIFGYLYTDSIARTDTPVNIEINCSTIYKANILDYKGSLPGATYIIDP